MTPQRGEDDLRPIAISKGAERQQDVSDMATRIVATYRAGTPEQHAAGPHWYSREAHGASRALAAGWDPNSPAGRFLGTMPHPRERGDLPRGETVERKPTAYDNAFETRVTRASGAIARLSPSGGGMHWDVPEPGAPGGRRLQNAHAVYELSQMGEDTIRHIMKNDRSSLAGRTYATPRIPDIERAHNILTGRTSAAEDTKSQSPERVKVGSFHSAIVSGGDTPNVTVDARSHDIATGARRPWNPDKDTRKLGYKPRYDMIEQAHQQATMRINMGNIMRGEPTMTPPETQATTWLIDKAHQEKQIGGTGSTAHLHAGEGGKAIGRRQLPTPAGQEGMQPHARFSQPRPPRKKK